VSECESNKQTLAHGVFSVGHLLQCSLLIMDFLIFRHISLVAEVIEVASICLGVELWDEGGALGSKGIPINLSEVLMRVDVLD
jgi:hypothetical protein